jgi:hypothetical protein
MWRDLERICAAGGIPLRRPSQFPRNGLLAARVACCFADAPWVGAFVRAVYTANFAEDADISTPETVARCLACAGEDPVALIARARSAESKERLRAQTTRRSGSGSSARPRSSWATSSSGATTGSTTRCVGRARRTDSRLRASFEQTRTRAELARRAGSGSWHAPCSTLLGRLPMRNRRLEGGRAGWILLWLLGVPIPVLLVLYVLRGCT